MMEKYVVTAIQSPENFKSPPRRQWGRIAAELNGKLSSQYKHQVSGLLLDSYMEMKVFPHLYHIGDELCPTHLNRTINILNGGPDVPLRREGVSGMEFDSKGIYVASVTKSGCLTIHDFETLYCSSYGPGIGLHVDESKNIFHICAMRQLDCVRWNPENQDEVACASRLSSKILFYDIGYISSEPTEVLRKGKSRISLHEIEGYSGISDIKFTSDGKSRLLAADAEGSIYIWDRRLSTTPYLEITNNLKAPLNSIELDSENRIVFGASKNGVIHAWDLRGGRTSLAFQSHNEVYHPLLTSVKISSMLESITTLKAQSDISQKGIHSINIDPSSPFQLSFHLDDGWSGVLNINLLSVTHMHCPPPAWLEEGNDIYTSISDIRRPSWLPTSSLYAVPCSSAPGIYLLDFYPDNSSACHVDYDDDAVDASEQIKRDSYNKFVHLSDGILVCAAHPLNGTVIAGTKQSSLMVISQENKPDENLMTPD